ncbi:UNVERIFIED_CONTAM: hypothetical protein K2H54_015764 [Gekko kuhli]
MKGKRQRWGRGNPLRADFYNQKEKKRKKNILAQFYVIYNIYGIISVTLKHFPFPAGGGIFFIHLYMKLIIFSFTATVELWVGGKQSKTIFIARPKDAVIL